MRETALATFARRLPLLRQIVSLEFHREEILEFFTERLSRWEGEYLLMDPYEIVQCDDEEVASRWSDIIRLFDVSVTPPDKVLEFFRRHSCLASRDEESLQVNLTGYCYGEIEKR